MSRPIIICTRGSALALAQSNQVLADLRRAFPTRTFELRIIRTTGDKLQTASLANPGESLPKGLFTKELEVALLAREADIAVHSLKDLPTELPTGLMLGATPPRADVRDVLLFRDAAHPAFAARAAGATGTAWFCGQPGCSLADLPAGAVVASSSTRRAAQVRLARPDATLVEIRGNVDTRLRKLVEGESLAATLLAAAGLRRLKNVFGPRGELGMDPDLSAEQREIFKAPPAGVLATILEPTEMLPAVGQGAVALEIREGDPEVAELVATLNHRETLVAVTAERAYLRAMGGGCQSPVAAHARVIGDQLELHAASFREALPKRASARGPVKEAEQLGENLAAQLR